VKREKGGSSDVGIKYSPPELSEKKEKARAQPEKGGVGDRVQRTEKKKVGCVEGEGGGRRCGIDARGMPSTRARKRRMEGVKRNDSSGKGGNQGVTRGRGRKKKRHLLE